MAFNYRSIKDKSITVDEEIGEAVITVTLYRQHPSEIRTRVSTKNVLSLFPGNNIKIIDVIKEDSISNRNKECTGTWIFKIPTIDPENSTTTVLKRRKKKQERKAVVEEDWNLGPEE